MNTSRRKVLGGIAGSAALAGGLRRAHAADDYPTKPVRLIVGYVPGGTTDYAARIIATALTAKLGQTVIVESKPGAESTIAVDYVKRSPPDGYTLIFANADATSLLTAVKEHVPYSIEKDFTYISRIIEIDYMVMVNSKLPIKTMSELVAYAKANPNKLRYGSSGVGSIPHVGGLLLQQKFDFKMVHVPYRGSAPAMTDTVSGVIDLGIQSMATIGDFAKTGNVRLLAVASETRDPNAPDVPTLAEAGYPGATVSNWLGIMAPANMPAAVVTRLKTAVVDSLNDPEVKQQFQRLSFDPAPLLGDDYRTMVLDEYKKWKEIAESTHLSID